ncbi:conserved oligomeric Golgi complex subunit 2-like [Tubulanus polymorphus]|uniref:conserved oligomeric Golgi complex subunit 2-like n=1 Tax=Tubulanus polymorphus TaxID=672921 RepID=UPI003DA31F40
MMTADDNMIPIACGSALCFDPDDFMKDDFDVDHFVTTCRHKVQLETLREDLHLYLVTLKSAMIELINKDYADFVNLSTNLVGMDKAIKNLTAPLDQLKEQIMKVRTSIAEAVNETQEKINKKNSIIKQKACLQQLMNIIKSVDKIELLLGIQQLEGVTHYTGELSGQLLERVATEFNKLQFYVSKNRNLPLIQEIKPRISNITTTLQFSLEGSFKEGLETSQIEILRQCLRTYATIDKIRDAENLFRQCAVRPYMEEVITEEFIQSNQHGLEAMYAAILDFIPTHCETLKQVTSGSFSNSGDVVRGYDFLVNAVWPEVIYNIEARTPSIFAPGNPDVFHNKYLVSMDFADRFERQCGSQASVKRLRAHPSYNTFFAKWSLPVYYQIRFQEIACNLEMALLTPFAKTNDTGFYLQSTSSVWSSLHLCWSDHIYLSPLCPKFWKLTLQILARYTSWITELQEKELMATDAKEKKESKQNEIENQPASSELVNPAEPLHTCITMQQIITLITDTENLSQRLPEVLSEVIKPKLIQIGCDDLTLYEGSIADSQNSMCDQLKPFDDYIVLEITNLCSIHLKLVSDIPRLYRRTNREVPTKSSPYVSSIAKPIHSFIDEHKDIIRTERKKIWITQILRNLTSQYYTITNDVLTSVRKMEDSLKRLKKARGSITSLSQGMTDDDKIRTQFKIDIKEFGEQIEALGISKDDIESYEKLSELATDSKPASANNSSSTMGNNNNSEMKTVSESHAGNT